MFVWGPGHYLCTFPHGGSPITKSPSPPGPWQLPWRGDGTDLVQFSRLRNKSVSEITLNVVSVVQQEPEQRRNIPERHISKASRTRNEVQHPVGKILQSSKSSGLVE